MKKHTCLNQRFKITYSLAGTRKEAYRRAEDICFEQTVEFPPDIVPQGFISDYIVGKIESFKGNSQRRFTTVISYGIETTGFEFTQLLNIIFGNISLKPGIRLEKIELSQELLSMFTGPRFGQNGLRDYLKVYNRPILCTAIKPLGLSTQALAKYAYKFALGGIDIIKDDHGLANQCFAPFSERVKRCAEAIHRANKKTGGNSIYVPNITAGPESMLEKAFFAKKHGAGGLLIAPGLCGFVSMQQIANEKKITLPIISHPAFLGSFVISPHQGISHYVLFGQLMRLGGADATIYPNFGGRFSFTKDDCQNIVQGSTIAMGYIKTTFPAPGGGMSLSHLPEIIEFYGQNVVLLIGGDLWKAGPDMVKNAQLFYQKVSKKNYCLKK